MPSSFKLTEPQRRSLHWAKQKYHDGRVPPFLFRYRSIDILLDAGVIETWVGYGAVMYKFTQKGLDLLESDGVK